MTTIDERGRAAARALREAIAARHDVIPVHELVDAPPKRRRWHPVAAAAMIVVLAGAVGAIAVGRGDEPDHVAARSYVARTISVQRGARQVTLAPDGTLWVLGGCSVTPTTCNELRRAGDPQRAAQDLPAGVDRALTYASGSLWAAGGGDGAVPTGTEVRLAATTGTVQRQYDFAGMTPSEVVGAYDAVWVLDVQHARVLRIDPATNVTKFFPLRTKSLGRVEPQQMLVADGTIVVTTRCCGTNPQYAQVGRLNRDGTYTTFFSTIGQLAVATDGTNLWVNSPTGPTHKFAISRANKDAVSWYSLLDEDYPMQPGVKFATRRSVWSVRADGGTVQRLDRRTRKLEPPFTLPRGTFDGTELDVAQAETHAWLLDGTHGVLYEVRDPND
jgi:hypothetical protein